MSNAWEDGVQILIAEMAIDDFAEHAAEIGGQREVASFVELFGRQVRASVHKLGPFHRTADHEHHVGVAMVGSAIAVLARGAAEFRHRDNDRARRRVAQGRSRTRRSTVTSR